MSSVGFQEVYGRVSWISIFPLSVNLISDFGIVPIMWYFLVFHFINHKIKIDCLRNL